MRRILLRTGALIVAMLTAFGAMSAAVAEPPLSAPVTAWLRSAAECGKVSNADCAIASDGWALAISSRGCLRLPADHGDFVAYRAGTGLVAILGTGECSGFAAKDVVAPGAQWPLRFRPTAVKHHKGHTFGGEATFYDPGRGACGKRSSRDDLVVAMPASMYDSSCGRSLRVRHGEASVEVVAVDRCGGCGFGDLDLSRAAFAKLAPLGKGRIEITWEFVG